MALTAYETNLQNLLQLPGAAVGLYPTTDLDLWINIARGQVAGESESIRAIGTLNTVVGQRVYSFSSLNFGSSATTGVRGAINVRRISYNVGAGTQWFAGRPWEWFDLVCLNNSAPVNGPPTTWSQYSQGAAPPAAGGSNSSGSFYIDPPPDGVYTLNCDCTCYPIPLVDDTTFEALPYLWTDAVPFFAAYYAFLSSQTGARAADAERMYGYYKEFVNRARTAANPAVNRYQFEQAPDPTIVSKLGAKADQR